MCDRLQIHVALASDDNYFRGLLVTAISIVEHCSKPNHLVFHVLDGGIADDNWHFLRLQLERHHSQVERLCVDQGNFAHLVAWHGDSKMTYARLLLPEILPNVQCVVYSDVDFLWLDDISILWEQRNDSVALQYVPLTARDPLCFGSEDDWLIKHKLTIDAETYFCAGMVMMNLDMFRAKRLHHIVLAVLNDNGGDAPMVDQTALNVVFSRLKEKEALPVRWQQMTSDHGVFQDGPHAVLHYAGDCPWKPLKYTNHFLTDFHLLWHLTYARINRISLWQSLRLGNSPFMIALGRLLYLSVCHSGIIKKVLEKYLLMKGKDAAFLKGLFRIPSAVFDAEEK